MPFEKVGKTVRFPRNEHVDIVVREVLLNADAPESAHVPTVEIREFIKEGEVYGHGLTLPTRNIRDLVTALERVVR